MKSLFKAQKFFYSETPRLNYADLEAQKMTPLRAYEKTPNFVPYYNGVRNNYNELQTDWEQINLLKAGEEITEDDKKKLIETYQNAVIKKLKNDNMNVRNGEDMFVILRIIGQREELNRLVSEMQEYIKEKQVNADQYKGKLTMKNGKLELTHNSSLIRPQTNITINFPITHTEIIENLKIEKRAEVLAKKQLEKLQSELPQPQNNKNATEKTEENTTTTERIIQPQTSHTVTTEKTPENKEKTKTISELIGNSWNIGEFKVISDTNGYSQYDKNNNVFTFLPDYSLRLHKLENETKLTKEQISTIWLKTFTHEGMTIYVPKDFELHTNGNEIKIRHENPKKQKEYIKAIDEGKITTQDTSEKTTTPTETKDSYVTPDWHASIEAYHKGKYYLVDFKWQEFLHNANGDIPDNAIINNNLGYIIPEEGALKYMTREEAEKNRDNAVYLGKNKKWEEIFATKDSVRFVSGALTPENNEKTETAEMKQIKSIQEKIGFTGADIDGIKGIKTESAIMGYNSRAKNGGENLEITANMTPEQIKEIQTKLGFTGTLIDGKVGIRTQSALIGYNSNKNNDTIT